MVGRFTAYKGHTVVLAAVAKILSLATNGIALTLVGSGELLESIKARISQLGLADHVWIHSDVSDASLGELYASCDLVCLPSLDRAEAFGMVLLEAMAHGKPVIAARVEGSGMGWVVEDGQTGWLVAPGDAEALANRMSWCLDHMDELPQYGLLGKKRVDEMFTEEKIVASVLAL
jgi:rhamnosyl/mannosyltransferase